MTFRNIEFLIQEAFVGIWRNGVMAVASITTIALSLSILGAFVLLSFGTTSFINRELNRFEIGAFMDQGLPRKDAIEIGEKIKKVDGVKDITFKPKEEAWPEFQKTMASKLDLGGVKANPLPDAYRIKVRDARNVERIAQQIRSMDGVEKVKEGKNELRYVLAVAKFVKYVSSIAGVMLFATCVFIISNAIRLTVFARRREIRIMQLVGAEDEFIRIPLIIEGMMLGAIGAVISVGLLRVGGFYLGGIVDKMMPLLRQVSSGVNPGQFASGLIGAGAVIGALGSLVSIRKFL